MPTNEQRRAAAKRKLERQLERRAQRARRRKKLLISSGALVVVVALAVVGVVLYNNHQAAVAAAKAAAYKAHTCDYQKTPDQPAPKGKDVGLPPNPNPKPTKGTVQVTLRTSQGPIPLTLQRSKAPCTVQSFVHLAKKSFFDNTPCHRLTAAKGSKVLQCGDPTGKGSGGPGYTIPDENPTQLKKAPGAAGAQGAKIYPRGTVAMANTGQPHSGGSQFFLVYQDSYLPPNYAIFGTVGKQGLATLDKIAKGGVKPVNGPQDGKPKLPVTIEQADVEQQHNPS